MRRGRHQLIHPGPCGILIFCDSRRSCPKPVIVTKYPGLLYSGSAVFLRPVCLFVLFYIRRDSISSTKQFGPLSLHPAGPNFHVRVRVEDIPTECDLVSGTDTHFRAASPSFAPRQSSCRALAPEIENSVRPSLCLAVTLPVSHAGPSQSHPRISKLRRQLEPGLAVNAWIHSWKCSSGPAAHESGFEFP